MAAAPAVTFDFPTWTAMFAEFSACTPTQGAAWFARASLHFWNSTANIAFQDGNLPALLYLLTSHIAWMSAPRDANGNPAASGAPASPLVGRISSAQEGTVNVQTEYDTGGGASPNEAWYLQTKYGAEFWNATAQYRTAQYAAQPTIVVNSPFPGTYFPPGIWRN